MTRTRGKHAASTQIRKEAYKTRKWGIIARNAREPTLICGFRFFVAQLKNRATIRPMIGEPVVTVQCARCNKCPALLI